MLRIEMCVCGHSQSMHRTYGCAALRPNPDPKKTDRVPCKCKAFEAQITNWSDFLKQA